MWHGMYHYSSVMEYLRTKMNDTRLRARAHTQFSSWPKTKEFGKVVEKVTGEGEKCTFLPVIHSFGTIL